MPEEWLRKLWHSESTEKYAAIKNDPFEGDVATWKCLYKAGKNEGRKMQFACAPPWWRKSWATQVKMGETSGKQKGGMKRGPMFFLINSSVNN